MKNLLMVLGAILLTCTLILVCVFGGWFNTLFGNEVEYIDQKIDDATSYETRKAVEDSCRAMVASYEADKLTWEQYKNSDNAEERSWANQARMRANRTAANFNNYVLKNSYVWDGNIPVDIKSSLEVLGDG